MRIILKKLKLTNFKKLTGEWEFCSETNTFRGMNGTGKTTIYDAECWLRTGKDSQRKEKFDIKTIIHGETMRRAEHSVLGVYDIDGEELTLERVYAEKWTKKRGGLEKKFDGHVTTYRLNNKAKTTKREFDAKVNEIFGNEKFHLVSDPAYFAKLSWERRRELLTEIAGEINKEKFIDSILGFRELLDGNSPNEKNALAKQRRLQINDDLKTLPARIDEHKTQIAKLTGGIITLAQAEKNVENASQAFLLAKSNIANFEKSQSSDTGDKISELYEYLRDARKKFEEEKTEAQNEINKREARISLLSSEISRKEKAIDANLQKTRQLRDKYKRVHANIFEEMKNVCHFCRQIIICPHCDEKDEKAKRHFLKNKSETLEQIQIEGKQIMQAVQELKEKVHDDKKELTELEALERPIILDAEESQEIKKLKAEIETLETQEPEIEIPEVLMQSLTDANQILDEARQDLSMLKANDESEKRVAELESKMKTLSGEFDELEKFFHLFDEYNQQLAELTENSVNHLFKYVRFRMFNTQINGGIVPACDIMNNESKPYETALSTGERIKAGLDIIETFCRHFQLWGPVFIDHAESFTSPVNLDCQIIRLEASANESKLILLKSKITI